MRECHVASPSRNDEKSPCPDTRGFSCGPFSDLVALRRAAVPPRVVSPHGAAAGLERMAAVELEWLGVVLHLAPQSGESLYRRGRRLRQQLRNVAAPPHAA